MSTIEYFNKKRESSRYEALFIDLYLDTNNTDPEFGRVDFWTEESSRATPKTTKDIDAFNPDEPKKIYRFSSSDLGEGAGPHYPILDRRSISSSAKIKIGELSISSEMTLKIFDIVTNDAYELQGNYSDRRVRGSLTRKLKARNYLNGRKIVVNRGFMYPGEPFNQENFETEEYLIKESKMDKSGNLSIKIVDPIFKAQKSKGKAPFESNGTLLGDINATQTSITIQSPDSIERQTQNGKIFMQEFSLEGTGYPAKTFYIRISDEIIKLSENLNDQVDNGNGSLTFNNVQRGQFNTVAEAHNDESKTEKCLDLTGKKIQDALYLLFTDYLNIPREYISQGEWADIDVGDIDLAGIISKPKDALSVINELLAVSRAGIYWDAEISRFIMIGTIENKDPVATFDYRTNIEAGSLTAEEKTIKQVTRQTIRYSKRDYSKGDDEDNFTRSYTYVDGIVESEGNEGVTNLGKDIKTSFLDSSPSSTQFAISCATNTVLRDSSAPIEFTFTTDVEYIGYTRTGVQCISVGWETRCWQTVDTKSKVWLGSLINIYCQEYTNSDGEPIEVQCLITEVKRKGGGMWQVKAQTFTKDTLVDDVDFVVDTDLVSTEENGGISLGDLFPGPKPEGRQAKVLIQSGASIIGTESIDGTYTIPALKTGNNADWPDGLRIYVRGVLMGAGGRGGDGGNSGGDREADDVTNPENGRNGGDALVVECNNCTIDNGQGGIIWAGGGGAGGNAPYFYYRRSGAWYEPDRVYRAYCPGSGGSSGAGGSRNEHVFLNGNKVVSGDAGDGERGRHDRYNSGTDGGTWYQYIEPIDGSRSDSKGQDVYRPQSINAPKDGGDFGEDGLQGHSQNTYLYDRSPSNVFIDGGSPGLAGYAIRLQGVSELPIVIAGNNSLQLKGRVAR